MQMAILDGNAYDAKCLEAGQERDEDLEACCLHHNNKQQALLVPSGAAAHNAAGKVVVQLTVSLLQCLSPCSCNAVPCTSGLKENSMMSSKVTAAPIGLGARDY